MDYEVPISSKPIEPVTDAVPVSVVEPTQYEVPISSNPSYTDHVFVSSNPAYQLMTVSTTTASMPKPPDSTKSSEYYDTFDSNKISTQRNRAYQPVVPKPTVISSCGQHKKKNKSILSCINEDLTNWEYILAALSILSVVVSIIVIILSVTIPNTGMTTTVTSTKTTQSSSLVSNIIGSTCSCSKINQTSLQLSESYLKQLLSIRQEIKELKWDKNFSMRNIIGHLSYYKYQIKVINESLQQLMQPRQPTLSGLNLTSSISINHGGCVTERLECTATELINLNPGLGIDIGQSTTDYTSYANETHIVVGASCSVVPHPNYYNTTLPLPMGTAISINKNNNQLTGVTGLQLLKQSTIGCFCFNYNRHDAHCYGYIKRCSYQEDSVQTGRISIHL